MKIFKYEKNEFSWDCKIINRAWLEFAFTCVCVCIMQMWHTDFHVRASRL